MVSFTMIQKLLIVCEVSVVTFLVGHLTVYPYKVTFNSVCLKLAFTASANCFHMWVCCCPYISGYWDCSLPFLPGTHFFILVTAAPLTSLLKAVWFQSLFKQSYSSHDSSNLIPVHILNNCPISLVCIWSFSSIGIMS